MIFSKTPKDIERETGKKFVDICKELLDLGLSPTEISNTLNLSHVSNISNYINRERISHVQETLYPELVGLSFERIEELFPKQAGTSYKQFLQNKYLNEGMSSQAVAMLLGMNERTMQRHIKRYGLTKSLSEARYHAIERGLIDYGEINAKGRRTMRRSKSSSHKQEIVRTLFQHHLQHFIKQMNVNDVEVVVGMDEWGILIDREVDIPIIIIHSESQRFGKYSVEYNGNRWHDGEDKEKEHRLTRHGWRHYVVWDNASNNRIELQIRDVSRCILSDFLETSIVDDDAL